MVHEKLLRAGDQRSAALLRTNYEQEITHVAAAMRWFRFACERAGEEPAALFHRLVRKLFRGDLKRPFNVEARDQAGMPREFYEPLA